MGYIYLTGSIFLLTLIGCVNSNTPKMEKSEIEKIDEVQKKQKYFNPLLDSFKALLAKETGILDSLEKAKKLSKTKDENLSKKLKESMRKYNYYLQRIEENKISY